MIKEYYPTPKQLLDKILNGVKWNRVHSVLEPSAGMGDIADYISENSQKHYNSLEIDCIEKEPELQKVLTGKGYPVICDDFLSFHTYKVYDLIVMNPPFSEGDKHLLKALDLMHDMGGDIVCILNAETIKNPYSNSRKDLMRKLSDLNAEIEYMDGAFENAVRKTNVKIAVIKVHLEGKKYESDILAGLRGKMYSEHTAKEQTEVVVNDLVEAAIQQYEFEVEAGIKLIHEYESLRPHLLERIGPSDYNYPLMELSLKGKKPLLINSFVKLVRKKYWTALFGNNRFTKGMTSNLVNEYKSKVDELAAYDFSYYNIKTLQETMCKELISGVEECIIQLFDKLSYQHAYDNELSKNIHYYNGWKTNQSWIINKKVIIPWMNAFGDYSWENEFRPTRYNIWEKLSDIEKAFNYLDSGHTDASENFSYEALKEAERSGVTKKIRLKFFDITFYKKGTCHIEFRDLELLKKLNIFGSQQKGWLPPSYGKKKYDDMTPDEQHVIDDFEGKDSYEKILSNAEYYIYTPHHALLMLDLKEGGTYV